MSQIKTCTTPLSKPFRYTFTFVFMVFLQVGMVTAQQHARDSIEERINKLKGSPNFSTKDTVYIDLLNNLGFELRFYKSDSLFLLSKEALTHSKEIRYTNGQCRALLGLGDYYSDKGDFEKAIKNYTRASELAPNVSNSELILRTQNNLAGEYVYKGDYARALEIYLKAIEMAKDYGNKKMLSIMKREHRQPVCFSKGL